MHLRIPDLRVHSLHARINLHAKTGSCQAVSHFLAVIGMAVRNRNDDGLNRGQPNGKRPGVMLDQNCDKSLEAAEYRAVDHDRAVFGVVRADVFQIEVFRLCVIKLDCCALPIAANRVGYIEINFRPVKGAVFFVNRIRHPGAFEGSFELRFGMVPCRYLT